MERKAKNVSIALYGDIKRLKVKCRPIKGLKGPSDKGDFFSIHNTKDIFHAFDFNH